jgi:hypothetical protein
MTKPASPIQNFLESQLCKVYRDIYISRTISLSQYESLGAPSLKEIVR